MGRALRKNMSVSIGVQGQDDSGYGLKDQSGFLDAAGGSNNVSMHSSLKHLSKYRIGNSIIDQKEQKKEKQSSELKQLQTTSQTNKSNSLFYNIFFKMKLRMFSLRLLNRTKSRMFQNMTKEQYMQLDDSSTFLEKSKQKRMYLTNKQKKMQAQLTALKSIYDKQTTMTPQFAHSDSVDPSSKPSIFSRLIDYSERAAIWLRQRSVITRVTACLALIPVFDPSSNWKLLWDFMIMALSVFYTVLIPWYITFSLSLSFFSSYTFVIVSSILFLIDIIVNMNTGYFEKGILELRRGLALRNYLRKNLQADIIGGIYFFFHALVKERQWVSIENNENPSFNVVEWLSLLFLVRISSFSSTLKKLEEVSYLTKKQKNIMGVVKLLFTIVIIAHLIACFWVKLAIVEQNVGENSWMVVRKIDTGPWYVQYIESYYFTTVTMVTVGYGEVSPITHLEQCISVIIMIISCGVFAYSMNTIGQILNDFSSVEVMIETNMFVMNTYMKKKNISKQTQYKIREYLEYYWREQSEGDHDAEERIIDQLSDVLKHALSIEGNKIILKDSNIFRNNFSEIVLTKTIQLIQEQRCTPEQVIFEEGDRTDHQHIYFVQKGSVELFIEAESRPTKRFKTLKTLTQGSSFGELGFFTGNSRSVSIRSKEFTTLLMISRRDFIELIQSFEKDYESFCSIKDSLTFYQNYSVIDMNCFSCASQTHLIHQCPYIHSVSNKDVIISKEQRSITQDRQLKFRLIQSKSNALLIHSECEELGKAFQTDNSELIEAIFEDEDDDDDDDENEYEQTEEGNQADETKCTEQANRTEIDPSSGKKGRSQIGSPDGGLGDLSEGESEFLPVEMTISQLKNTAQNVNSHPEPFVSFNTNRNELSVINEETQETPPQFSSATSPSFNFNLMSNSVDVPFSTSASSRPLNSKGKLSWNMKSSKSKQFPNSNFGQEDQGIHADLREIYALQRVQQLQQQQQQLQQQQQMIQSQMGYSGSPMNRISKSKRLLTQMAMPFDRVNDPKQRHQAARSSWRRQSNSEKDESTLSSMRDDLYNLIASSNSNSMNRSNASQQLRAISKAKRFMISQSSREIFDEQTSPFARRDEQPMMRGRGGSNGGVQQSQFNPHSILSQQQQQGQAMAQFPMLFQSQFFDEKAQMQLRRILFEEQALKDSIIRNSFAPKEKEYEVFDLQKNFDIYFPYNNLSYLLSIPDDLTGKERAAQFRRIHILNMQHIQQNIKLYVKGQNSPNFKSSSIMKRMVNKFQLKEFKFKQTLGNDKNIDGADAEKDGENVPKMAGVDDIQSLAPLSITKKQSMRKTELILNHRKSKGGNNSINLPGSSPSLSKLDVSETASKGQKFVLTNLLDAIHTGAGTTVSKEMIQEASLIEEKNSMLSNRESFSAREFMITKPPSEDVENTQSKPESAHARDLSEIEIQLQDNEDKSPIPPVQEGVSTQKHIPFN